MAIPQIRKDSFTHLRKDSLRKRLELIEFATGMFIEQGYEKASMNQLVKRSGCSKSTLYKHFESKEALFIAVIDDALQDHLAPIDEINLSDLEVGEGLRRIANAGIDVITSEKHISLCRIIYAEAERIPSVGALYYSHGPERGIGGTAAYLEHLVESGIIECEDPAVASDHFWAMLLHKPMLKRYCDLTPPMSRTERDQYTDVIVQQFISAFLTINEEVA
jgi:TetR/AcrR family transcriptional repressor of mexJK operon